MMAMVVRRVFIDMDASAAVTALPGGLIPGHGVNRDGSAAVLRWAESLSLVMRDGLARHRRTDAH